MHTWTFVIGWILAWAGVGGAIVVLVETARLSRQQRRLMAAGLYPQPGTETEADARRLWEGGYRDLAVRCYQAVHQLSHQQARERLVGAAPARYGLLALGLVFGLSIGLLTKHTALGTTGGLLLGVILTFHLGKPAPPGH